MQSRAIPENKNGSGVLYNKLTGCTQSIPNLPVDECATVSNILESDYQGHKAPKYGGCLHWFSMHKRGKEVKFQVGF